MQIGRYTVSTHTIKSDKRTNVTSRKRDNERAARVQTIFRGYEFDYYFHLYRRNGLTQNVHYMRECVHTVPSFGVACLKCISFSFFSLKQQLNSFVFFVLSFCDIRFVDSITHEPMSRYFAVGVVDFFHFVSHLIRGSSITEIVHLYVYVCPAHFELGWWSQHTWSLWKTTTRWLQVFFV